MQYTGHAQREPHSTTGWSLAPHSDLYLPQPATRIAMKLAFLTLMSIVALNTHGAPAQFEAVTVTMLTTSTSDLASTHELQSDVKSGDFKLFFRLRCTPIGPRQKVFSMGGGQSRAEERIGNLVRIDHHPLPGLPLALKLTLPIQPVPIR